MLWKKERDASRESRLGPVWADGRTGCYLTTRKPRLESSVTRWYHPLSGYPCALCRCASSSQTVATDCLFSEHSFRRASVVIGFVLAPGVRCRHLWYNTKGKAQAKMVGMASHEENKRVYEDSECIPT